MSKICVSINYCNNGDVVAEDIDNENGITLVPKRTVMNQFIKYRLEEIGINYVWVYEPTEFIGEGLGRKKHKIAMYNYKRSILMAKKVLLELSSGRNIKYSELSKIVNIIYDNIDDKALIIQAMAEINDADEYTYTHCVNVALYSMLIAEWLNLSKTAVKEVIMAGLLHDIGKIKVPIEILNKKEKLTQEEFELIKRHPEYGYEMIKDKPEIPHSIALGVRQHHERMDSSGYPDKLNGNDIGLYGKIVAIADVYDAMTQNRIYKKGVTPFESFEMFMTSGMRSFDIDILSTFLKYLPTYLTGAKVLLNNSDKGKIVYVPPADILNPVVQVRNNFVDLSKEKDVKISSFLFEP